MPKTIQNSSIVKQRTFTETGRFLGYSVALRSFLKEKKGVFGASVKLLRQMTLSGAKNASAMGGSLRVKRLFFKHTNQYNNALFCVSFGGHSFFVKNSVEPFTQKEVAVWERAQKTIDSISGGLFGYSVKLIVPQMWVDNFLVSSYYPNNSFIPVAQLKDSPKKSEILDVIDRMNKLLQKSGVMDAVPRNALYSPKTKTIYFVDLISDERYSIKERRRLKHTHFGSK